MISPMTLQARLLDPQHFVTLYGATPPRADSQPDAVARAAEKLAARARHLPLDGLVVYDVQDETERTAEPRPFPFLPTMEPRTYARLLQDLTEMPAITYKSVGAMTETSWPDWLSETRQDYGISYLTLVGASSPNPPPDALPVDRALQLAAAHAGSFTLGGVVIAERHSPAYDESRRLLHKADQGCRFFISQVVYHADATIRLLTSYAEDCRRLGVAPRRIMLTFSPCGRPRTIEFLKWLGVAIAPATEQALLADPAPFTRSIQICRDNLRAILDRVDVEAIPLGINIESVSIHKDEIEASVDLVHTLYDVAQSYGLDRGRHECAAQRS